MVYLENHFQNMNSLENLEVWKQARAMRIWISNLTKQLPSEEKFRLVDQMLRASRSISANIAEGHGRYHYQENIQFCRQARGSLVELYDHISCALDENFITEENYQYFIVSYESLSKIINGYIAFLKRKKGDI